MKKKSLYSKLLIVFIVLANLGIVFLDMYIMVRTGAEPVMGVKVWFGFSTVELWALASIKKKKINKIDNNNEDLRC